MSFPIAVQVYSVREDAKADLAAALRSIKEMGYDGVEFAGMYDHSAEEIRDLCREIGLEPISAHVGFVDMLKDPIGLLSQYKTIGCKYVAIPALTTEHRPDNANFPYVMQMIRTVAEAAKSLGLQLLYHNHDFEFMKLGGKYALDLLYETVPADLLKTELDVCWVNVGGEDPAAFVRKYAGRAPVVHLKDFWGDRSAAAYEIIGGIEGKAPKRPDGFEYRPLGRGLQNIPSIIDAAHDAGTEWVVVELDKPSMGLTPMECIRESIEYLKSIGA